jgi:hypothetical protein
MKTILSVAVAVLLSGGSAASAACMMGEMKMPAPAGSSDNGVAATLKSGCDQCMQMGSMTHESCCTEHGACCKGNAKSMGAAAASAAIAKNRMKPNGAAAQSDHNDVQTQMPSGQMPMDAMPASKGTMKPEGEMGMHGKMKGMKMGPPPGGADANGMGQSGGSGTMTDKPAQTQTKKHGKGHKQMAPSQDPAQAQPADPQGMQQSDAPGGDM